MKLAPKQLFFTIVLVLSGAIVTLVINSTSPIAAVSNSAFIQMSNLLRLLMVDATSKPLGNSQSKVMTKPSTIWGGCMKKAPPYPRVGRRS